MTSKINGNIPNEPDVTNCQENEAHANNGNAFRCMVYLIPEDEGGFSILAANLPGAASQGDSEEEALSNIVEALQGVIEAYKESGETIPWTPMPRVKDDPNTIVRWVVVHA